MTTVNRCPLPPRPNFNHLIPSAFPQPIPASSSNPRPHVAPLTLTATNCNNNSVTSQQNLNHGANVLLSFTKNNGVTPTTADSFHTSPIVNGSWADETDTHETRNKGKRNSKRPVVPSLTNANTAPSASSQTKVQFQIQSPIDNTVFRNRPYQPLKPARDTSPGDKSDHWDTSPIDARSQRSAYYAAYHGLPYQERQRQQEQDQHLGVPGSGADMSDEGDSFSDQAGGVPLQQTISQENASVAGITPSSNANRPPLIVPSSSSHNTHSSSQYIPFDSSTSRIPTSLSHVSTSSHHANVAHHNDAVSSSNLHASSAGGIHIETGDEGISDTSFSNKFDFVNDPAAGESADADDDCDHEDGVPKVISPESEAKLTECITSYMGNGTVNPYQGSLPVERVQNFARSQQPQLYAEVVGFGHNCWKRFVNRHMDKFILFIAENGKGRMRLHVHTEWKKGDQQEQAQRGEFDQHLVRCLESHLQHLRSRRCTVDEFIESYPGLPENKERETLGLSIHSLPMRGDLVRFIRRHSSLFWYNNANFQITLRTMSSGEQQQQGGGAGNGGNRAGGYGGPAPRHQIQNRGYHQSQNQNQNRGRIDNTRDDLSNYPYGKFPM